MKIEGKILGVQICNGQVVSTVGVYDPRHPNLTAESDYGDSPNFAIPGQYEVGAVLDITIEVRGEAKTASA